MTGVAEKIKIRFSVKDLVVKELQAFANKFEILVQKNFFLFSLFNLILLKYNHTVLGQGNNSEPILFKDKERNKY